jgi:hypothetical protein
MVMADVATAPAAPLTLAVAPLPAAEVAGGALLPAAAVAAALEAVVGAALGPVAVVALEAAIGGFEAA